MALTQEQIRRAQAIRDAIAIGETQITDLTQTLAQTIQDARDGLIAPPQPGEPWDERKSYIQGDTATDGGALYTALRYSRGMRPTQSPQHWEQAGQTAPLPNWSDIPDGSVIFEGDTVTDGGKAWECIEQHIKSAVYKPKAGSSKWVEVG